MSKVTKGNKRRHGDSQEKTAYKQFLPCDYVDINVNREIKRISSKITDNNGNPYKNDIRLELCKKCGTSKGIGATCPFCRN